MNNFIYEKDQEKINLEDLIETYLNEISRYPVLSKEEEIELFNKVKLGDNSAKDLFIKCNLRLVVSISKKHINKGMDFLDIIQEGNLGLMKAVEKFDIEMGCKFSTYATYWIERFIYYAFAKKSKIVRVPTKIYNDIRKYKAIESKLEQELFRKPTLEEISQEMEMSIIQAEKIYNYSLETVSLDHEVDDFNDSCLGDLIPSNINLEEEFIDKERLIQIKELLLSANLKQENLEMLILRYTTDMTLRDIAKEYDICHQSVTCKLESSLKKIRKMNNINQLKTYI